MEHAKVGQRIKTEREKVGWTQTQLATTAGITASALSQIENGERFPSTVVLHKLARALSTSVDFLLGNKTEEELSDLLQDKKIEVLFRSYRELSKKDRDIIMEHVSFLKNKKK